MNTHSASRRAVQRGLSYVESLTGIAMLAVGLASALPGIQETRSRLQLEATASQLVTDVRQARSMAIAMGAPVRLSVQQVSEGACYVIHTGASGDCTCDERGATQCVGASQVLRAVGLDRRQFIQVSSNSRSMLFDAYRGTVTPTGTLSLDAADGRSLKVVVNIMGRARTCSPAGAIRGYPAC